MNWYKTAKDITKDLSGEELEKFTKPKWISVKSSWIDSAAYYKPLGMLEIKLKNGLVYGFGGVPEDIFKRFMRAKSKGQFFNRVIRPTYKKTN